MNFTVRAFLLGFMPMGTNVHTDTVKISIGMALNTYSDLLYV